MNRRLLVLIAMGCALPGAFAAFRDEYASHAPAPHGVPSRWWPRPAAVCD